MFSIGPLEPRDWDGKTEKQDMLAFLNHDASPIYYLGVISFLNCMYVFGHGIPWVNSTLTFFSAKEEIVGDGVEVILF